jgi:hypothetical protein
MLTSLIDVDFTYQCLLPSVLYKAHSTVPNIPVAWRWEIHLVPGASQVRMATVAGGSQKVIR